MSPLVSVSLCVTPTKLLKAKGGKRKGAKATKNIERLLSKGHVLDPDEATAFRALSARGNYLAADRPDIGYSAKELCLELAQPNPNSFMKLSRMACYLISHKRLAYKHAWGDPQTVDPPSDEIFVCTLTGFLRIVVRPDGAPVVEFLCTMATA